MKSIILFLCFSGALKHKRKQRRGKKQRAQPGIDFGQLIGRAVDVKNALNDAPRRERGNAQMPADGGNAMMTGGD